MVLSCVVCLAFRYSIFLLLIVLDNSFFFLRLGRWRCVELFWFKCVGFDVARVQVVSRSDKQANTEDISANKSYL